jgi:multidrug efflux system membrane fusion protein
VSDDQGYSGIDGGAATTPWYRRKRTLVFALLIVGLVGLALIVRNLQNKNVNQPQGRPGAAGTAAGKGGQSGQGGPVAVAVATAASGDIRVRIPALGTITPLASVTVRTQISGQLQKIAFTEGQLVRAGDFLAQIDPRPYEAALEAAKGNLKRDQALLADARLDLTRYEALIKEDAVSGQQLDTQRALVDQYVGTVESDQAAVRTADVNLTYTHITSPVSGRVGLRLVDQGNYVTPGDTNGIVIVNQLEPITAILPVPEDNTDRIMRRVRAGETLTVEAYDRSNTKKLADGRLSSVDNQIDTTTGTVRLRALFDNKDGSLFPNQFVNIQLLVTTLHDQIVIPNAAVHQGAPSGVLTSFVYLVNAADTTVSVRPVTTGIVDGEQVAVTKGLQAGDIVVTEGGDRLRDGATVLLPAATPVHQAPAATPATKDHGHHRSRPAGTS